MTPTAPPAPTAADEERIRHLESSLKKQMQVRYSDAFLKHLTSTALGPRPPVSVPSDAVATVAAPMLNAVQAIHALTAVIANTMA